MNLVITRLLYGSTRSMQKDTQKGRATSASAEATACIKLGGKP